MRIAGDEPEWIIEQARARKRRELLCQREDIEARLAKVRAKDKAQKEKFLKAEPGAKRRKVGKHETLDGEDDEQQFILDDYDSDNEKPKKTEGANKFSTETLALMGKLGMVNGPAKEELEELEDETKVCQAFVNIK